MLNLPACCLFGIDYKFKTQSWKCTFIERTVPSKWIACTLDTVWHNRRRSRVLYRNVNLDNLPGRGLVPPVW